MKFWLVFALNVNTYAVIAYKRQSVANCLIEVIWSEDDLNKCFCLDN